MTRSAGSSMFHYFHRSGQIVRSGAVCLVRTRPGSRLRQVGPVTRFGGQMLEVCQEPIHSQHRASPWPTQGLQWVAPIMPRCAQLLGNTVDDINPALPIVGTFAEAISIRGKRCRVTALAGHWPQSSTVVRNIPSFP